MKHKLGVRILCLCIAALMCLTLFGLCHRITFHTVSRANEGENNTR